jgi:hypothetical protein
MAPQGLHEVVMITPSENIIEKDYLVSDGQESISAGGSEPLQENNSLSSPGLDISSSASTGTRGSDDGFNKNLDNTVICRSRWFFITLLFCCTTILCGVVFATMKKGETDAFEANVCARTVATRYMIVEDI